MADLVARRSYGRLVAFLATRSWDLTLAEDALSEAFLAALADWPRNGCPANPDAWLMTAAKRKMIDAARSRIRDQATIEAAVNLVTEPDLPEIPDRRLQMMFACAHPSIEVGIRAPLILQLVLGLNAHEIASAFLTSPAAMGKRLVRAKEKFRIAGIPFHIPETEQLPERLGAILEAIYAAYSEGWIDPAGVDPGRRNLTEESIYLSRLVAELLPNEAEALGLLALLLYSHGRSRSRRFRDEYVPISAQDPSLWDASIIAEAEKTLLRAASLDSIGRFQLEASIQSAHIFRRVTGRANQADICQLYDALFQITQSPVVALNRILVRAELDGPENALKLLQSIELDSRIRDYQPYWAARAELLAKANALQEAYQAYEIAIGLENDPAVRRFLRKRQEALNSNT